MTGLDIVMVFAVILFARLGVRLVSKYIKMKNSIFIIINDYNNKKISKMSDDIKKLMNTSPSKDNKIKLLLLDEIDYIIREGKFNKNLVY